VKDQWYWDQRRKAYVLHAFDQLFKRGGGELRFHHYKASIVISGGADFDALIKVINKARKACLSGPALKATKHDVALKEAKAFRRRKKR